MSKNFKDLINTVEKETQTKAELEQSIHSLKEEINKMEFTIKEQKLLIEDLKTQKKNDQIIDEQIKLPSEVEILKDMIVSQRQELNQKDKLIDTLQDKIDELSILMKNDNIVKIDQQNEELFNTQIRLDELLNENKDLKNELEELNIKIHDIESKKNETENLEGSPILKQIDDELINFKRLNFQLMEENGLLRVEIESLKSQIKALEQQLEQTSKPAIISNEDALLITELREKSDKIKSELIEYKQENQNLLEQLTKLKEKELEIESLKSQIKALEQQLEQTSKPAIISNEDALLITELREKSDKIESELIEYKQENQNLLEQLTELKEKAKENSIADDELLHQREASEEFALQEIAALKLEIEAYKIQIQDLESQLLNYNKPSYTSLFQSQEIETLNYELERAQKEINRLNNTVSKLKEEQTIHGINKINQTNFTYTLPSRSEIPIFIKFYELLDNISKEKIINKLLKELKSTNHEIRRRTVKILGRFMNNRIYNIFLDMIDDDDWLVRYYIIIALSKFNINNAEFKAKLILLSRDNDVDVREVALKILDKLSD